jgi:hypothetical protein
MPWADAVDHHDTVLTNLVGLVKRLQADYTTPTVWDPLADVRTHCLAVLADLVQTSNELRQSILQATVESVTAPPPLTQQERDEMLALSTSRRRTGDTRLLTRLEGIHDDKEFEKKQFLTDVEYLYKTEYITPEMLSMLKRTSKSTRDMVENWKLPCKVKVSQDWFGEGQAEQNRLLGQKIQSLQALHPILELDLSGIPIMLNIVGPVLARCTDMTHLNLSGIRPLFKADGDATSMAASFSQYKLLENIVVGTHLTHLDLSNTDVDDGIAYTLAGWLPRGRPPLTHLNLSNNEGLWQEKAKLALIRAEFPALVDLDLSGSPFNDRQEEVLVDAWRDAGKPPGGLHL